MDYETILFRKEHGSVIITFNRPKKRNALNQEMTDEIEQALRVADGDSDVKAIILTGGEEFFISGADIEFLLGSGQELTAQRMYQLHFPTQSVYRCLETMRKPTIAAIAGFVYGGGLELALCCDFRIATTNAKIGTPEIKLGILPGAGGTQRLARIVGLTKAKEMVLTGEPILAEEAYLFGLLNKVVPKDRLMDEAEAFAKLFWTLPSFSVEIGKELIETGYNMSLKDALEFEKLGFSLLYSTEDQKEGLKAFMEKRLPKFKGK